MAQDNLLTACDVTFHTLDDDKDRYTHVTITVRNGAKEEVASIDDDFGYFAANSNNGPFNLSIVKQVPKSTFGANGWVNIRIDPSNEFDTWTFNLKLGLVFTDGKSLNANENEIELTAERREHNIPIAD